MAHLRFAPGERVTQLSVFPGPDNSGRPNARAGALTFATSGVRLLPAPAMFAEAEALCNSRGSAPTAGCGLRQIRQWQHAREKQ